MLVPPIIERELRVALRRYGAVKSRTKTAAGGVAVVCAFILFSALFGSKPGRTLHTALVLGALYLAIIPAAQISVGLFCEERRNQTLELLYLTGMSSAEMFLGKVLSGALIASSNLLALAPLLAVPFFSGGLSVNLFFATVGCLPVMLLLAISIGVLASTLCRDDGAALMLAVVLGAAICLAAPLPYYLGKAIAGTAPFSAKWLCVSPAYAPYLVLTNFLRSTPREFWLTSGITIVWAMLAIGIAAECLRRNWRTQIARGGSGGLSGKWENWAHGAAEWRKDLRAQLLERNPFQWLAQQDRRPVFAAWGMIAGVVALWLLGWAIWGHYWATPMSLYITAAVLLFGLNLIMRFAAAKPIANERREGSLELLLTTPLGPEDILVGQMAAIRSQFKPVRWALEGLFALMMLGGLLTRHWTELALASYALIWFCFVWSASMIENDGQNVPRAMWIGMWSGRAMYAIFPRRGKNKMTRIFWFWWLCSMGPSVFRGLISAGRFPSGSIVEFAIVAAVFLVFGIAFLIKLFDVGNRPLEGRLVNEMRLIARQPLPDTRDPRFRQWDMNDYPPAPIKTAPDKMTIGGYIGRALGRMWAGWRARRWER